MALMSLIHCFKNLFSIQDPNKQARQKKYNNLERLLEEADSRKVSAEKLNNAVHNWLFEMKTSDASAFESKQLHEQRENANTLVIDSISEFLLPKDTDFDGQTQDAKKVFRDSNGKSAYLVVADGVSGSSNPKVYADTLVAVMAKERIHSIPQIATKLVEIRDTAILNQKKQTLEWYENRAVRTGKVLTEQDKKNVMWDIELSWSEEQGKGGSSTFASIDINWDDKQKKLIGKIFTLGDSIVLIKHDDGTTEVWPSIDMIFDNQPRQIGARGDRLHFIPSEVVEGEVVLRKGDIVVLATDGIGNALLRPKIGSIADLVDQITNISDNEAYRTFVNDARINKLVDIDDATLIFTKIGDSLGNS
jgi:hypothetical protein